MYAKLSHSAPSSPEATVHVDGQLAVVVVAGRELVGDRSTQQGQPNNGGG